MKRCHKCGEAVTIEKVSRRDECEACHSDLRVCLNCRFYDQSKADQCFEPQVEPVKEKDRSNYCDFFQFREEGRKESAKDDAERLWKDLFKKG
ncbi:MAG: hypothetical protein ABSD38_01240 [Syntrophorhabdales bacterium]|jgi:hypothetical protein